MSALGQKRTLFTASLYVRFAPESGHSDHRTACPLSAITRLSHALAKQHLGAATNVIQLEGQHCPLGFESTPCGDGNQQSCAPSMRCRSIGPCKPRLASARENRFCVQL